jgi:hypothetical protein
MKGSFWWSDILRLLEKLKGFASITVNLGDTCFIWHDPWGGLVASQAYPHFFSFARSKSITIFKARTVEISQLF